MPAETGLRGSERLTKDRRKHDSRIADNPSATALSNSVALARAAKAITGAMQGLGLKNETVDRIYQSSAEALRGTDLLELPDRFNDAFSDKGWIATPSFRAETMRRAVDLQREGRPDEAEQEILEWFSEGNYSPPSPATFSRTHNRKDFRRQEVRTAV